MCNSIKQLCRNPMKLILFFVLISASTVLLMVGSSMWMKTARQLDATEKVFTTIGTVAQKETKMETFSLWDAAKKEYINSAFPAYDSIVPESALQFEGANYLNGPQKRPFYGALLQGYEKAPVNSQNNSLYFFAEFSPVEDCIPDKPVLVNIKKVLSGDAHDSKQFWFCDHYTENPAPMKAGKTYIAGLWYQDNAHEDVQIPSGLEFTPWLYPNSTQTDSSGTLVKSEMNLPENVRWEEVTENFYQTGRGKYWQAFAEREALSQQIFPVLPTESCSLLPSFHKGDSAVTQGREITSEEFQSGEAVCMVTQEFAKQNNLHIGDCISIPLSFANYKVSPGYCFGYHFGAIAFSFSNAKGDFYPVFWEESYEIVGFYRYQGASPADFSGSSEMGRDMIIIPSKSVKASDDNNIADYGPMIASTTSFQIPNGSISDFDAAFQKTAASKLLKIEYDDNGYEQISGSLKQSRNVAALLCIIGVLAVMVVILLLLYFFIIKQKKRTAIERSLGMNRRQCRISLSGGVMVLTIAAVIVGSLISLEVTSQMQDIGEDSQSHYSLEYSSWRAEDADAELTAKIDATEDSIFPVILIVALLLILFTLILSVIFVNKNLKIEPIVLLGQRGDGA